MDEPDEFFAPPNPKKVLVINYNRQKRPSWGTGKAIRCSNMHKNPLMAAKKPHNRMQDGTLLGWPFNNRHC